MASSFSRMLLLRQLELKEEQAEQIAKELERLERKCQRMNRELKPLDYLTHVLEELTVLLDAGKIDEAKELLEANNLSGIITVKPDEGVQ